MSRTADSQTGRQTKDGRTEMTVGRPAGRTFVNDHGHSLLVDGLPARYTDGQADGPPASRRRFASQALVDRRHRCVLRTDTVAAADRREIHR